MNDEKRPTTRPRVRALADDDEHVTRPMPPRLPERVTPPNRPAVHDPRRTAGRNPAIEVGPRPKPPALPAEDVEQGRIALINRLIDERIRDLRSGLEAHIDQSIESAIERVIGAKLTSIELKIDANYDETREFRIRQKIELEHRAKTLHDASLMKLGAETSQAQASALVIPGNAKWGRLAPVIAVFGVIGAALIAVVAAMFKSRFDGGR